MLLLSRKTNESITIGSGIRVTIVSIRGDKVQLGVEAPKAIPVNRSEIADLKAADGALDTRPPAGVLKKGWVMQIGPTLMWSPSTNLSDRVDLSDVVSWRFPESVPVGKRLVEVGPEAEVV